MGLDMYLTKRRKGANPEDELVAYWRKANHIHGWFERNVADGYIENCELYPVCLENLNCLMSDCRLVREDRTKAATILPTEDGFFFGSTEYDERYFEDIDCTIEQLEKVISETREYDELFYHAWW